MLEVKSLSRTFKVPVRKEGFGEAVRSLFNRKYEIKEAVNDVSFSIKQGEIVGLLGPNGAGKSTLIKMLTGILKSSKGEISVLGFDPFNERFNYVRNIGALFGQKSQLWWHIPPVDSFLLSKELYDIPEKEFQERKNRMIKLLDAEDIVHKPVRTLSLGERMKCEFIAALLHNPKIVFLDEPTIGLDAFAKESIRSFVRELNKTGTTFILTTHDMDDIDQLAQRVIVINEGQKVFDDSMDALRKISGARKRVHVKTYKKLSVPKKGVSEWKRVSDTEAYFLLDTSKQPLHEVLKAFSKHGIEDLEVQSPDVEELIKEIYES